LLSFFMSFFNAVVIESMILRDSNMMEII